MQTEKRSLLSLFGLAVIGLCQFTSIPLARAQDSFGLPLYGFNAPQGEVAPTQPDLQSAIVEQKAADIHQITPPQRDDYQKNEASKVFGAQLFTGAFARQAAVHFNPDYAINIGDTVNIRLWGAYNFQAALTVDPQGNIFLPNVGPVNLVGVNNADLQNRIDQAVRSVFRNNVFSYASLAAAQPVRVFVGGFVNRPGAYAGTSLDSILHYLDQAGGIDPDRGSFLDIEVKRGSVVRASINLYRFLFAGNIPQVQLADGDVIFVHARQRTTEVSGLAENSRIFEFSGESLSLSELSNYAKPKPEATHVRITRNTGTVRNVEYYPLSEGSSVFIGNGDQVAFTADKKLGTITVRIEGEHESAQEFVLPHGSRLGDVLSQISYSERSAQNNIQLFRHSVRDRQRDALEVSLRSLEAAALTARSGTSDEARLRKDEADLLLRFVDRARKIEPKGQVTIAQSDTKDQLLLENGDIIRVPSRDGLILVNGEVLFPNAVAYDPRLGLQEYIDQAGGYTNNSNSSRIIIAHQDGSFTRAKNGVKEKVIAGDQIMVLPSIDTKNRQIFKELTQILYQVAVSAGVVLGL